MPSLSVVLPTLNRVTLSHALASCRGADEVICVADGKASWGAEDIFGESGLPGKCICLPKQPHFYGAAARNVGIDHCSGDWIAYMDDDDYFLPDAFETIKSAITSSAIFFFRAEMKHMGRAVWKEPRLQPGDISTLCIVHPNLRGLPKWVSGPGEDYQFAFALASALRPWWIDAVIARSETRGLGRRKVEISG